MSGKKSKHTRNIKNKRNNKNYKNIVFVVVLLIIIFMFVKKSNVKIRNENTEVIINNSDITGKLEKDIIVENDKVYMSFQDIRKFIDETIYQEEDTNLIITTSDKKVAAMKEGDEKIEINGSKQKKSDVVVNKDETEFIAISELEDVYDYEFSYMQNTNIITIDSLKQKSVKAYTKKNIKIKEKPNIISKTIDNVKQGNWIIYIGEENGFAKVRTQNGIIGYTKKKNLDNFIIEREDFKENNEENVDDSQKLIQDISKKDISSYEKRKNIIDLILQEAIKNDKMYVKITANEKDTQEYTRFKIEIVPILKECGIKVEF